MDVLVSTWNLEDGLLSSQIQVFAHQMGSHEGWRAFWDFSFAPQGCWLHGNGKGGGEGEGACGEVKSCKKAAG